METWAAVVPQASDKIRTVKSALPLSSSRITGHETLTLALEFSVTEVSIAARSAEEVAPDFHASLSAVAKTYRYRIYRRPLKPVMQPNHVYHFWRELDVEQMSAAAARLLGRHDFRGFASSAERRQNTIRTITRCDLNEPDGELHVTITGNGFLYKMVRNIVGSLVEIGRGRWQPGRIDRILQSRNRCDAGPTAPPAGLCLLRVEYPQSHKAGDA